MRPPPLEPSNLAMRKLGDSEAVLVASPAFLKQHGTPAHPSELENYPTADMARPGDRHVWEFREKDCTPITVNHTPRLMTDHFDALREAAITGIGIAYLPFFIVQQTLESGALTRVLPEYGLTPAIVHAVFPSRRGMVPAVRAFIDALANGFQRCPSSLADSWKG